MPVYHVKTPSGERIVDATTKAAAINHVMRDTITAEPITASAMLQLMAKGIQHETATVAKADPPVDEAKAAA